MPKQTNSLPLWWRTEGFYLLGTGILLLILLTAASFAVLRSLWVNNYFISITTLFVSSGFLAYYFWQKTNHANKTLKLFFILAIITLSALWLQSLFFDNSWDSLAYRKNNIIAMVQPINFFSDYDKTIPYLANIIDYPKLDWLFAAPFYLLSGEIEWGKITLLTSLASFLIFWSVLENLKPITNKRQIFIAVILGFLFAFTPVTISQLFTYYSDAAIAGCLTIALLSFLAILNNKNFSYLTPLLLSLIIMSGLKYNGMVFGFIILLFLLLGLLFSAKNRNANLRQIKQFLMSNQLLLTIIMLAGILTLFNPYLIHLLSGHHIFHTVWGNDHFISGQINAEFLSQNQIYKTLFSIFSYTNNTASDYPNLRIPFLSLFEAKYYSKSLKELIFTTDLRIGGWVVAFAEFFLIALLFLGWFILTKKYLLLWVLLLLLSFLLPDGWWARYNIAPYLLVVFVFFLTYLETNQQAFNRQWYHGFLVAVVLVFFTTNLVHMVRKIYTANKITKIVNTTLMQYQQTYGNKACPPNNFLGVIPLLQRYFTLDSTICQHSKISLEIPFTWGTKINF